MSKPDVDEIEIKAGQVALLRAYGSVIGENQARNLAYTVLVAARGAKLDAQRAQRSGATCPRCMAGHGENCRESPSKPCWREHHP